MREFTTAVNEKRRAEEAEDFIEFKIDGQAIKAYRPTPSQMAWAITATGRYTTLHDKIAGVIDFFVGVLDENSRTYVVNRLLDRDDDFGFEQVEEIIRFLTEEWSGRPTKQPSDS